MLEFYHTLKLKKLLRQSKAERLEQLVSYAEANPSSYLSQFFAAREAWFQRDLTTAQIYAKRALALDTKPYHIYMTIICAEYHVEHNEVAEAVDMAKQILVSRRSDLWIQKVNYVLSAPLLVIMPRRWWKGIQRFAEAKARYDEWQQWAEEYIRLHT